jgi:hypothetical protein
VADKVDILESDGFYTNADFLVKFAIKKVDGTVQPITNWALSWLMKVRTKDTDVSAVITKTTGTGITITDGPNGLSLREGVYVHELKRTDEGFETPLCAGKAVLKASVHRT